MRAAFSGKICKPRLSVEKVYISPMSRYLIVLLVLIWSQFVFAQDSKLKAQPSSPEKMVDAKTMGWSTAEINGVWWLIDPEGKPFYSKGVNIVTPGKESEKSRAGQAYCWLNFYSSI